MVENKKPILNYMRALMDHMDHMDGHHLGAAAHYLLAADEMAPTYSVFDTGLRTREYLRDRALECIQAADLSV